MNRFDELLNALDCYKRTVDDIVSGFLNAADAEKDKYNEKYYDIYRKNLIDKFGEQLTAARTKWTKRCNGILADTQDVLRSWVAKPIDQKTLNTIIALKDLRVKLTDGEIEALGDMIENSYFGRRILNEISPESGSYATFGNDLDVYLRAIRNSQSEADIMLNLYCGDQLQGKELLPEKSQKNLLLYSAASPVYLKPTSAILAASLLWDGDGIPEPRKNRLSETDQATLDKMFRDCKGKEAIADREREVLKLNPGMRQIFSLSPYYNKFLPTEEDAG